MVKEFIYNAQFDQRFFEILVEELMLKKPEEIFIFPAFPPEAPFMISQSYPIKHGVRTMIRFLCRQIGYPLLVIDQAGWGKPCDFDKLLEEAKALYEILSKYAR